MNLWREANRAFYGSRVWTTLEEGGHRILKYPTDLYVFEEIIHRTKPEVIVETGSFEGGSAAWFARFADVISVDLASPRVPIVGVTWIQGDSVEMAGEIAELVADRSCLVTLDSDHHVEHVLAELEAYSPIASEYLVVEDTAIDEHGIDAEQYPEGGPGRAVQWFLQTSMIWSPDYDCDRFQLGMNPGGWLKRR